MYWGAAHAAWPLFGFFWFILLALAISLPVRRFAFGRGRWYGPYRGHGGPWGAGPGPSAMEILCQRYARGEIDAATFDQMRERLENASRPRE